ncbi:NADH-cytochrome b5 reductase, partial [Entomortierella chlamydospora]
MTLSNTSMIAVSGVILAGSYLIDPTTLPFIAAGVAATWARVLFKGTNGANRPPPMDPKEYRKFTLVDKIPCSPNTA